MKNIFFHKFNKFTIYNFEHYILPLLCDFFCAKLEPNFKIQKKMLRISESFFLNLLKSAEKALTKAIK